MASRRAAFVDVHAEIAPEEALLEAINQPLLHNMELHHISHAHTTGHVRLFFYSKAAAEKVRQADHLTLGVIGGHEMKLTPRKDITPAGKPTWHHAIVSSNLPGPDFAKPSMLLPHFQLLTTTALSMGTGMASNGRIRTEQPQLYFYEARQTKSWTLAKSPSTIFPACSIPPWAAALRRCQEWSPQTDPDFTCFSQPTRLIACATQQQ